jgi:integrase
MCIHPAHDLRRTFAKLAHKGGAPIDPIQLSLDRNSIQTTGHYLGVDQDLTTASCDVCWAYGCEPGV